MTARDAAFLGCRLMALWFGVFGVIQLPIALAAQALLAQMSPDTQSFVEQFVEASPVYMAAAHLVVAAVLFYGAERFSGALVRDPEKPLGPMSQKSFLAAGAVLIGIYAAARYIPGLVESAIDSFAQKMGERATDKSSLIANLVGMVLAIAFFVGAILWSKREGWTDDS